MYCDACGAQTTKGDLFCKACGNHMSPAQRASFSLCYKILLLIALACAGGYYVYTTHASLLHVSQELDGAKSAITQFQASTTALLSNQEKIISKQKSELTQKQSDLLATQRTQVASAGTGSPTYASLVSKFSPSMVKVICNSNSQSTQFQQGSGTLYKTGNASQPYIVWTNLHVVETSDNSLSQCIVVVYSNISLSQGYKVFAASGYSTTNASLDFAVLTPEVSSSLQNAGTFADLAQYSMSVASAKDCSGPDVGDSLLVLGYPAVGGSTLTVTEGIISGFEYNFGARYIKTSAKIDHGNSGGLALLSSGCVLGIPTLVSEGELESIGFILDVASIRRFGQ